MNLVTCCLSTHLCCYASETCNRSFCACEASLITQEKIVLLLKCSTRRKQCSSPGYSIGEQIAREVLYSFTRESKCSHSVVHGAGTPLNFGCLPPCVSVQQHLCLALESLRKWQGARKCLSVVRWWLSPVRWSSGHTCT